MRNWRGLTKVIAFYDHSMETILVILFSVMIVLMFSEVVARHVLNSPIIWSEELGRMLFIWCVYLGAAIAFSRKSHITVDYFTQFLPANLKGPMIIFVNILVMVALVFVVIMGTRFAAMSFTTPAYSIPFVKLGWAYMAVPFGALTMFINLLRTFAQKTPPD